jgi:hypothetical protein
MSQLSEGQSKVEVRADYNVLLCLIRSILSTFESYSSNQSHSHMLKIDMISKKLVNHILDLKCVLC